MDRNYLDINYSYPNEKWIECKDFLDYMVSDFGRVMSLPKTVKQPNGGYKTTKRKIIKPSITDKGYYHVRLYKNGKQINWRLHRLVYSSFIGEIGELEINHKDCVKSNNSLHNLETCTRQENMDHAVRNGRLKRNIVKP
jgi:hypothetical protein